ncbi:lipopolysaccharide assembly protein LapA domain-containing protein [Cognaticolwellia aestuarii]|jgi:putative membrane protein|uniref:lipopolysaccharide assembly protein LapA domain-containing protein n=1 Tax=Cognaticolwellia aestuarii TaxID=329993 RepID=UPI0009866A08|nr:lipopolysaccharide assembly protein LapA domain-containing protein [Cognaticolwellia aestuarii]
MRLYITVILFLLLLAVAFIFGSQNDQVLTLNYLIAKTNLSVAAAVSLFTTIGFVLGLLFALFWKLLRMIKPTKNVALPAGKKS